LQDGIVKDLVDNVPGVAAPNAIMSDLLRLKDPLARSTGRINNQDVFGLKDAVLLGDSITKSQGVLPFILAMAAKARSTERAAKVVHATGNIASKIPARQAIRSGLEAAMYSSTGGQ
jgi:hypothetical protein